MAAKPADFFIGVADLFTILLPGALLSYLAIDMATQHIIDGITPPIQGGSFGIFDRR
ncbi:MAG: hypothetical protein ABSG65_21660 [Bryobacteraceae bacterium]|jgi:hypothetical protein